MSQSQTYPNFIFTLPEKEESILLNPDSKHPTGSEWFPECRPILEFAARGATALSSTNPMYTPTLPHTSSTIEEGRDGTDANCLSSVSTPSSSSRKEDLELCFAQKIYQAILTIRMAMRQFRTLAFSFNGGKDNTVVLYLIRAACLQAVTEEYSDYEDLTPHELLRARFTFFYIHYDVQIAQVIKFLCLQDYQQNLGTVVYTGTKFKDCIINFYNDVHPDAVFMGVRSTDPNGKTTIFSYCSPSWPQFRRVSPILYWTYVDIWDFLKRFRIHYCMLYDRGYTSLGSALHTVKHPTLKNGAIMHQRLTGMVNDPQFSGMGSSLEKLSIEKITSMFTSKLALVSRCRPEKFDVESDDASSPGYYDSVCTPIDSVHVQPCMHATGLLSEQSIISEDHQVNVKQVKGPKKGGNKALMIVNYTCHDTVDSRRTVKEKDTRSTSPLSLVSITDEEVDQTTFSVPTSSASKVSPSSLLTKKNLHGLCGTYNCTRAKCVDTSPDPAISNSEDYSDGTSIRSYMGKYHHKPKHIEPKDQASNYSGPRLVIDELIARGVPTNLLPPQYGPIGDDDNSDDSCGASAIFLPVSEGEDERINRS